MTQDAVVMAIVAAAAGWAVWWTVRTLRSKQGGGCSCGGHTCAGCTGCAAKGGQGTCHCADNKKHTPHTIKPAKRR